MKTEILELIRSQDQEKECGELEDLLKKEQEKVEKMKKDQEKERGQVADQLKKKQENVEKMKKLAEGYLVENNLLKQEITNNNERVTGVRERKTRKSKAAAKYLFYLHKQM